MESPERQGGSGPLRRVLRLNPDAEPFVPVSATQTPLDDGLPSSGNTVDGQTEIGARGTAGAVPAAASDRRTLTRGELLAATRQHRITTKSVSSATMGEGHGPTVSKSKMGTDPRSPARVAGSSPARQQPGARAAIQPQDRPTHVSEQQARLLRQSQAAHDGLPPPSAATRLSYSRVVAAAGAHGAVPMQRLVGKVPSLSASTAASHKLGTSPLAVPPERARGKIVLPASHPLQPFNTSARSNSSATAGMATGDAASMGAASASRGAVKDRAAANRSDSISTQSSSSKQKDSQQSLMQMLVSRLRHPPSTVDRHPTSSGHTPTSRKRQPQKIVFNPFAPKYSVASLAAGARRSTKSSTAAAAATAGSMTSSLSSAAAAAAAGRGAAATMGLLVRNAGSSALRPGRRGSTRAATAATKSTITAAEGRHLASGRSGDSRFHRNMLDSTAPSRYLRGKQRLRPKKKRPSRLKAIIRQEKRQMRTMKRQKLSLKFCQQLVEELVLQRAPLLLPPPEKTGSLGRARQPNRRLTASEKKSMPVAETPSQLIPRLLSAAVRGYVTQMLSKDLDAAVTALVQTLIRFQKRAMSINPTKANARRRYVSGFKECLQRVKRGQCRCLIVATDLEEIQILDDKLRSLLKEAAARNIQVVFSQTRHRLAQAMFKPRAVTVTCIALLMVDGAEEEYARVTALASELRARYATLAALQEAQDRQIAELQQQSQQPGPGIADGGVSDA